MKALKIAAFVAPIVGVAFVVWREQTLEAQLSVFVERSNRAIQEAIDGLVRSAEDAMSDAATARATLQ